MEVHVHCIEAECIYNNGLAQCANTCPDLHCENTAAETPEFYCDSYMDSDMAMDGEDW